MSSRDFLILDEACFDQGLGRPAKAIVSVDSISSIQECVFDEFVSMDQQGTFVGSVLCIHAGGPVVLRVRDKAQDIVLDIIELTNSVDPVARETFKDQFVVHAKSEFPENNVNFGAK